MVKKFFFKVYFLYKNKKNIKGSIIFFVCAWKCKFECTCMCMCVCLCVCALKKRERERERGCKDSINRDKNI